MRVLVLPADMGGCGHYRLIFAAEHLQLLGHDVHIQYPEKGKGFNVHFVGDRMVDFELPVEGVDILVMQRVSHTLHQQAIPLLRSKGVAVVVDMDDDLSTIHPQNTAFWTYRDKSKSPYSYRNALQTCSQATYVTVSTRQLMKVYVKHGRGQTLDNYIPERYLTLQGVRDNGGPVFGWGGTLLSHPTDLRVIGDSVKKLVAEGHRFRVVGPDDPQLGSHFKLSAHPDVTGTLSQFNWPSGLATLDVGIAPLEASTFNSSKSRLKPLEYNATGSPYVASPRDEYRRYHREANGGLLADTPKQWATAIRELMINEQLRKELAEQGKAHARTQTIEGNSWRFWEAWTNAHEIQKKANAE